MTAILSKLAIPLLLVVFGTVAGIGLQQRVLSRKEVVKVDYDKVREIIAQEMKKLPKPEPGQSIDIEKIRGKGAKVDLHQHYHIEMNGDSLALQNFRSMVAEELAKLKISKCK